MVFGRDESRDETVRAGRGRLRLLSECPTSRRSRGRMSGVEAENGTGPAEEADAGGAPSPKRRALKLGPLKPLPAQDKERYVVPHRVYR